MRVLKENLLVQFSLVYLVIMITFGVVISATSGGMLNTMMASHMTMMSLGSDQASVIEDFNNFRWFNLGIFAASFTALYSGLVFIIWRGSGTFTRERSRMGAFNADLEWQLQERTVEMSVADEVGRIISSTLDIAQVCEEFTRELKNLVDVDQAAICLVDREAGTYTLKYLFGQQLPGREIGMLLPLAETLTGHVTTTGQILVRDDIDTQPHFSDDVAHQEMGLRSCIALPLVSKGRMIGSWNLRSRRVSAFGEREKVVLQRLAKQIAPAVENASLYEQVQAGIEEQAVVDEVAQIITSTLDIDQVYQRFALEMKKLVDFDRVAINTINHDDDTFTVRYIYGPTVEERPLGTPIPLAGTQPEKVARSGKTHWRNNFADEPITSIDSKWEAMGLSSSIVVPLISKARVVGTFALRSRRSDAYGPRDQIILERLAKQIAPALENAILFEQVQDGIEEKAVVDEVASIITSTLNIDHVYEKFASEVKKLVYFDRAAINTINHDDNTFTVRYVCGVESQARPLGTPISLENNQVGEVVKIQKSIRRVNIADDPKSTLDIELAARGIDAVISVPLISKGRVIATFGPHDQAILERLAKQIAPAIENAQMYEQLQTNATEKAVVDEIARIITSTLNIDEVYEKFALEIKKLVDFDRAVINTIDLNAKTSTSRYVYGLDTHQSSLDRPTPLENTTVGEVVRTRKSIRRVGAADEPKTSTDPEWAAMGLKSLVSVPLISKGVVIGTFGLRSFQSDAFGPNDQRILEGLAKQITPAIENTRLFEQTKAAEEELSKLSCAVEQSSSGVLITDTEGIIQYVNPKFTEITGYSLEEILGQTPRLLKSGQTPPEDYQQLWETLSSGQEWHGEFLNRRKNGELYWASESISPIRSPDAQITHYVAVEEDVTERKQLEEQLLQSQKIETVGRLAGGVAHDFNNLLTAIIGYTNMAKAKIHSGEDVESYLDEALHASDRASKLISQLLAFSRKQHVEAKVFDLNELILNLDKMLRRLISEDIELVIIPGAELASIKADPQQMEQVLMNLVVNARDAMAEGGRLIIATANYNPDEAETRQDSHLSSGQCVVLTVVDSGVGMSQEVKSHLFEPFFTTKGVGVGTGLGLSTCFGIVDQIGGSIEVESQPEVGTTFKIQIPVTEEAPVTLSSNEDLGGVPHGSETILLAEDESAVRAMVGQILREQGYEVLEAVNGDEALRLSSNETQSIHLLVTDVIMPGIGGPELADRLCVDRPDIKVLFTSGYTEGIKFSSKNIPSNAAFLQKPYMPDALARKVREVLDH